MSDDLFFPEDSIKDEEFIDDDPEDWILTILEEDGEESEVVEDEQD
jgi:hypothetical protein